MISFLLSLVALIAGYMVYGRFLERIVAPGDTPTPAVAKADGVDYIVLPGWKIFMIQFLNIAGTGPIFGAIMGAKFGPVAYLWIVLGCIFAGAMHDYLSGMLSLRNDGAGLPELIGKYLGKTARKLMLAFTVLLLIIVGAVLVYSPAEILHSIGGPSAMWIALIFFYYIIATMLPIDKIIGRIYPLFAFSLLFMALALLGCLLVKWPALPELWTDFGNLGHERLGLSDSIFPALFITIACGAISGFHATQSPLMARCMKSERQGRPFFYGAMITEGIVALIWATVSSYFFYASPTPGYQAFSAATAGVQTSAPAVVNIVCNDWLGIVGGILAMLGVVAAPITSGDTALRSARLIIADALKCEQRSLKKRLLISIPLFVLAFALLMWQIDNPNGFNIIWQYFSWANQTLSVFTLWMLTVWLTLSKRPFVVALVPAVFMTVVCSTFLLISKMALGLAPEIAYAGSGVVLVGALVWFFTWYRKQLTKTI